MLTKVTNVTTDDSNDDTQRLLRESVRSFMEKKGDIQRVRASRASNTGFDRAIWQIMADNGWLGLLLPKEVGGFGLGFAEATIIYEEMGRRLLPEPIIPAVVLAAGALRGCENTSFQAEMLSAIVAGKALPALAWQEKNENYDPNAIATRVVEDGSVLRISGTKRFIPSAASADGFLVTAISPVGTGLYWVALESPGLTLLLERSVDDVAYGTLRLADVAVSTQHIACSKGADDAVSRAVDEARLCVCAELVGVMSQALELTLDYVKQREQFGQKLGSFQVLQHRIVDLFIQQELSRNTLAQAVTIFDGTQDPVRRASAVSAAKARASDAALLITRQAIQLHGGIGFTDECNIGLFLKRALVLAAWLGNSKVHRKRFGCITLPT